MNRFCFAFIFALFTVFPALAQESVPDSVPVREKHWRLGAAEFTGDNLSSQNEYMLAVLPSLIMNELRSISIIDPHFLADSLAREAYWSALRENSLQLTQKRIGLDSAKLQGVASARVKALDTDYQKPLKIRESLSLVDPLSLHVTAESSLTLVPGVPPLFEMKYSAKDLCDKEKLDFLVYGSVVEIQGYLFITSYLYSRYTDESIIVYEDAAEPEHLAPVIHDFVKLCITALNPDSARLVFTGLKTGSLVEIDGKPVMVSSDSSLTVPSGLHEIRISHPGFRVFTVSVSVSPQEIQTINVIHEETSSLGFNMSVEGAAQDLATIWIDGFPQEDGTIRSDSVFYLMTADGYDARFGLIPFPGSEKPVVLQTQGNTALNRRNARDAFFSNLTWLLVSLPLPAILYGMSQDYAYRLQNSGNSTIQLSADERNRITVMANVCYYGYLGSLGLSGGISLVTILSLLDYISRQ